MFIWVKRLAVALVVFIVVAQVIRPSRINPPVDPAREIGATRSVSPEVAAIFERSCNDCHSNRTVWPWYTGVFPVSWLVAYDVREGRRELNFSEWDTYNSQERQKLLEKVCSEVSEGEMPGLPYSLIHPRAKLSAADVQTLCTWTQTAREAAPLQTRGI